MDRPKAIKPNIQKSLAPLEHKRNLYADAAAALPEDRRIRGKQDLLDVLASVERRRAERAARAAQAGLVSESKTGQSLAAEEPTDTPPDALEVALADLEQQVAERKARCNDVRASCTAKKAEIEKVQSNIESIRKENASLAPGATPESVKIQELQGHIQEATERMWEKEFRKRQLTHMRDRLAANDVTFTSHVKSMDDALAVAKRELGDVRRSLRVMETGRAQAREELKKRQKQAKDARARRHAKISAKRGEAQNIRSAEEWRQKREGARAEMAAKLAGDLSRDQEDQLVEQKKQIEEELGKLSEERTKREDEAAGLQHTLDRIRQLLGVTSLTDMVQRFVSQGQQRRAVRRERQEAERRLGAAKAALQAAQERLKVLQATGAEPGAGGAAYGSGGSADDVEELEKRAKEAKGQASAAASRLRKLKAEVTKYEGAVVGIRQGALGILQRLQPFEGLLQRAMQVEEARGRKLSPKGGAGSAQGNSPGSRWGSEGKSGEQHEGGDEGPGNEDEDATGLVFPGGEASADLGIGRKLVGAGGPAEEEEEGVHGRGRRAGAGAGDGEGKDGNERETEHDGKANDDDDESVAYSESSVDLLHRLEREEAAAEEEGGGGGGVAGAGGGSVVSMVDVSRQGREARLLLAKALRRVGALVRLVEASVGPEALATIHAATPSRPGSKGSGIGMGGPAVVVATAHPSDPVPHANNVRVHPRPQTRNATSRGHEVDGEGDVAGLLGDLDGVTSARGAGGIVDADEDSDDAMEDVPPRRRRRAGAATGPAAGAGHGVEPGSGRSRDGTGEKDEHGGSDQDPGNNSSAGGVTAARQEARRRDRRISRMLSLLEQEEDDFEPGTEPMDSTVRVGSSQLPLGSKLPGVGPAFIAAPPSAQPGPRRGNREGGNRVTSAGGLRQPGGKSHGREGGDFPGGSTAPMLGSGAQRAGASAAAGSQQQRQQHLQQGSQSTGGLGGGGLKTGAYDVEEEEEPLLGHRSLKHRSQGAVRADEAVRKEEARRERLAASLQKDAERREVMDRLMRADVGKGTMAFLLEKPKLL